MKEFTGRRQFMATAIYRNGQTRMLINNFLRGLFSKVYSVHIRV